ncbi:MAG: response regulator [Ginsengibacter sp.]
MANILLVDDSEDLLEILSTFLKMKGYEVESALSQEKAKNTLSTFIPDVILLDVRINGHDGRELCKEIKEKYDPNIPIILLSASPELLKDYEECKADDIIEKPFNLATVIEKVNSAINKYKNIST